MKTFTFPLQKVLELKEKEKEQAEWAFGRSVRKKQEEEAKLEMLTEQREWIAHSLCDLQQKSCRAADLIEASRYQSAVDRAIQSQRQVLYGCEEEVERCQNRLALRMKETKLWHRMREKAKEQFDYEQKLHEQKELDEIGISRFYARANQK